MYVEQISGLLLHKPNFALSLVFFLDYKDTIFVLACEQFCFSAVRYSSLSKSTTLKNYILYFLYAQYVLKETDIYLIAFFSSCIVTHTETYIMVCLLELEELPKCQRV